MEWQILLVDALVGGLAGGLGALLTRKLAATQKVGRSIISVALVVGGITAANTMIAPRLRASLGRRKAPRLSAEPSFGAGHDRAARGQGDGPVDRPG